MSDNKYCTCEICELRTICVRENKPSAIFCDNHRFNMEVKRSDPNSDDYVDGYYLVKSSYKKYICETDTIEEISDGLLPIFIYTKEGVFNFMKEKDLFFENGIARTKSVEISDDHDHIIANSWYEFKFIPVSKKNYYGFCRL